MENIMHVESEYQVANILAHVAMFGTECEKRQMHDLLAPYPSVLELLADYVAWHQDADCLAVLRKRLKQNSEAVEALSSLRLTLTVRDILTLAAPRNRNIVVDGNGNTVLSICGTGIAIDSRR